MPEDQPPWPEDEAEPAFAAYEEGHEDEDHDEAYATYLDARRRFADIRAARGYWPVVAVPPSGNAQPPTSSSTLTSPHRPKGKGKGSKGKGGKGQRPFYQKGSGSSRAQSASQCLKCGQTGHWSSECPSNNKSLGTSTSPSKRTKTIEGYVYMASGDYEISDEQVTDGVYAVAETYVDQRALPQVCGIMDNGASSVLVGHNTLMDLLHCLHLHGIDVAALRFGSVHKMFHFVGDASSLSQWCIHLPVTVGGQHGRIQVFIKATLPF